MRNNYFRDIANLYQNGGQRLSKPTQDEFENFVKPLYNNYDWIKFQELPIQNQIRLVEESKIQSPQRFIYNRPTQEEYERYVKPKYPDYDSWEKFQELPIGAQIRTLESVRGYSPKDVKSDRFGKISKEGFDYYTNLFGGEKNFNSWETFQELPVRDQISIINNYKSIVYPNYYDQAWDNLSPAIEKMIPENDYAILLKQGDLPTNPDTGYFISEYEWRSIPREQRKDYLYKLRDEQNRRGVSWEEENFKDVIMSGWLQPREASARNELRGNKRPSPKKIGGIVLRKNFNK